MKASILVAYASRLGSTKEVAEAIAGSLRRRWVEVDVRSVSEVRDLETYRAVILGSAVRGGKWLPEALDFLEANRETLRRVPLAYFQVCMTLQQDTPATRAKARSFLGPVRAMLEPLEAESFAGKLEYARAPLVMRLVMRLIRTPEGDWRDWTAIRAWAERLYERFAFPVTAAPVVVLETASPRPN